MIGRSKDTRSNPLPTQDVFKSANRIIASKLIKRLIEECSGTYLVLSAWLEDTTANNLGVSALSCSYRKRLRTTNGMKRLHTVCKQQAVSDEIQSSKLKNPKISSPVILIWISESLIMCPV